MIHTMKKRCYVLLLSLILLLLPFTAYAADPDEIPGNVPQTAGEESTGYPADGPNISGTSAIVMDMDTGDILYRMNPHRKAEPASTTKLMTALLAVDNMDPGNTIKVTNSIYSNLIEDAVTIGLLPGEEITLRDMLYGMLLPSANDAANAIGEGVSGSISDFVNLMNEKAAGLGCRDTHFANTNGLPDENHYTTVYDMALIAIEAYKRPLIREVIATPSYWMAATSLSDKRELWTTNELLYDVTDLYYPYCTGGKTGYTGDAGYTMVAFAEKDGRRLVSVVFGCTTSVLRFQDSAALLNYGFNEYHILQPLKNYTLEMEAAATNPIGENFFSGLSHALPSYSIDKNVRIYTRSSISADDIVKTVKLNGNISNGVVGNISLSCNGKVLTEVPIYLDSSQLAEDKNSMLLSPDGNTASRNTPATVQEKGAILGDTLRKYGPGILLAIAAAVAVIVLLILLRKHQAKKRVQIRRYMGDRPPSASPSARRRKTRPRPVQYDDGYLGNDEPAPYGQRYTEKGRTPARSRSTGQRSGVSRSTGQRSNGSRRSAARYDENK